MQALLLSPTCEAFLFGTGLKASALFMLAFGIGYAMRKSAASWRYALWLAAFVGVGVLTVAGLVLPTWRVVPREVVVAEEWVKLIPLESSRSQSGIPVRQTAPANPPVVNAEPSAPRVSINASWPTPSLALIWAIVALVMAARVALGYWRLRKLERECLHSPVPEVLMKTLRSLWDEKRPCPRLLIGPASSVPMVWGIWRPRLLLPQGAEHWSQDKLSAVIHHELAHLRRRDVITLLFVHAVHAIHWFNPLAWLMLPWLRADQERACDDSVLRQGIKASEYAKYLLDFTGHHHHAHGLSLCALMVAHPSSMEHRLAAILDGHARRESLSTKSLRYWLLGSAGLAIPLAMFAAVAANTRGKIVDRNGVVLVETDRGGGRVHPYKALAAHVLGYTRKSENKDNVRRGVVGIERQAEELLSAGREVRLTLDARVQSIVEQSMIEAGVGRGAAVVLDPGTGDVLAMASLPNFDPGKWEPNISEANLKAYFSNKANPMINRTIQGYNPGSAFKPLPALAGCVAGVGNSTFECTGAVKYGRFDFRCWISRNGSGKHGLLNLEQALEHSCNCYFYQFGNEVGAEVFQKTAAQVGFGHAFGILAEETAGVIPSIEKMHTPAEIANASIGQGFVLVTPLQMAVLAATVANGGKVPQPRLLNPDEPVQWKADFVKDGAAPDQIARIGKGMWGVVNGSNGTAKKAQIGGAEVAGKTGTAQFWRFSDGAKVKDNHTWFMCFAPYDHPTLALAILVQGGFSGGSGCAPIAGQIIKRTLSLPAGASPLQAMEEQPGHFNGVSPPQ